MVFENRWNSEELILVERANVLEIRISNYPIPKQLVTYGSFIQIAHFFENLLEMLFIISQSL